MGGKAPAPPNYTPIANAQMEMAKEQSQVMREQLAWAKETWNADRDFMTDIFNITKPILESEAAYAMSNGENRQKLLEVQTRTAQREETAAIENRERYKNVYQPIEDDLIKTAKEADSPEKIAEMRGRAMGDVADQFDVARRKAAQQLEGMGIDAGQTRGGALNLAVNVQEASAKAAASEGARIGAENKALALRGEAINIGKGYPGQIAQANATALGGAQAGGANIAGAGTQGFNMGNSLISARNSTSANGGNMMGSPTQWGAGASGNYAGAANTLTQGYNAQLAQFKADSAVSSGIGSGLGSLLGFGLGFINKGGKIPHDPVDPAGRKDRFAIAVAGDEYVIPASAARRLGTKYLDRLVMQHGDEQDASAASHRMKTGKPGGQPNPPSADSGAIPLRME
jgi:hypothetical protein